MLHPVPLSEIVEGMEMQSDEFHSYLHRPTGRVLTISEEAIMAAEHNDEAWVTPEELAEARAMLADEAEYLALPDRFEINEYRMMERFAHSLENVGHREAALTALRGRGAFRYFKDTVHRLGMAQAWYAYRDASYRQVALAWCEDHGVEVDASASSGT